MLKISKEVKISLIVLQSFCKEKNYELNIKPASTIIYHKEKDNVMIHNIDIETLDYYERNEDEDLEDYDNEDDRNDKENEKFLYDGRNKGSYDDNGDEHVESEENDEDLEDYDDEDDINHKENEKYLYDGRNKGSDVENGEELVESEENDPNLENVGNALNKNKKCKRKKKVKDKTFRLSKKVKFNENDNNLNEEMQIEDDVNDVNGNEMQIDEVNDDEMQEEMQIDSDNNKFIENLLSLSNQNVFYHDLPVDEMKVNEANVEDVIYNCLLNELELFKNNGKLLLYHFRIGFYLSKIKEEVLSKKGDVIDQQLSRSIVKAIGIANAYKRREKYETKEANRFYHASLRVFGLYSLFPDPILTINRTADFISKTKLMNQKNYDEFLKQVMKGIFDNKIQGGLKIVHDSLSQIVDYDEYIEKHKEHIEKYFDNYLFRKDFIDDVLINSVISHINNRALNYNGNGMYSSIGLTRNRI